MMSAHNLTSMAMAISPPTDAVFVVNRVGMSVPPVDEIADVDGDGDVTSDDADAVIGRIGEPLDCALWVWINWLDPTYTNQTDRDDALSSVLGTLSDDNFTRVYLNAYGLVDNYPASLASFITAADTASIPVELLAGDANWVNDTSGGEDFVGDVLSFMANNPSVPVDGIHLDVEPHQLSTWVEPATDPANHTILTNYLDLLVLLHGEINSSGQTALLRVDIPFWYDQLVMPYGGANQSVLAHVLAIVDGATLMAYRDGAVGANCVIGIAQLSMTVAQAFSVPIVIGLETDSAVPDNQTFAQEGRDVMAAERRKIDRHFLADPNYAGIAVHHYETWGALPATTGNTSQC